MKWNPEPKNENLTVRVTKSDKHLFNHQAALNRTSTSNWAYQILQKHKYSYGKVEDVDGLLEGIEMALYGLEAYNESLEIQIRKIHRTEKKHLYLVSLKLKNATMINNLKKIKERLGQKKQCDLFGIGIID